MWILSRTGNMGWTDWIDLVVKVDGGVVAESRKDSEALGWKGGGTEADAASVTKPFGDQGGIPRIDVILKEAKKNLSTSLATRYGKRDSQKRF